MSAQASHLRALQAQLRSVLGLYAAHSSFTVVLNRPEDSVRQIKQLFDDMALDFDSRKRATNIILQIIKLTPIVVYDNIDEVL